MTYLPKPPHNAASACCTPAARPRHSRGTPAALPRRSTCCRTVIVTAIEQAHRLVEDRAQMDGMAAQARARLNVLTPREMDVLHGLVEGRANKVIAYDLEISPRTVEVYRANVMTKMQARSLSELVRMTILLQRP